MATITGNDRKTRHQYSMVLTVVLELFFVVGGYLCYKAVRLRVAGEAQSAFDNGWTVLRAERSLGLSFERSLQSAIAPVPELAQFFNIYYIAMYLPFIIVTAVYLFVWHRERYVHARRAFLLSGAIGLVVFATFPVAPPRLLPSSGFTDTLRLYLPEMAYTPNSVANQFAAVPSFHFGWCSLAAHCLAQTTASLRVRLGLYAIPLLMLVTIIVTGNHYWFDALVALLIVMLASRLAPYADHIRGVVPNQISIQRGGISGSGDAGTHRA